ncbi:hypothetical protein Acr_08g0005820 [Actinidia rufa]|uniref:Uncharacterized protein n=1 Tax=Actinidia rufa TaxID=165716 RepID=A0A7J0F140_9ERIC|nr:hypothetical protein Acr_08g0005820 [Actinidia rufa]
MLRRNVRLRREYIYRKSLEGKERLLYEKKRKIKEALEEGKPIPTELRNEEAALRQQIDLEDEHTAENMYLGSPPLFYVVHYALNEHLGTPPF